MSIVLQWTTEPPDGWRARMLGQDSKDLKDLRVEIRKALIGRNSRADLLIIVGADGHVLVSMNAKADYAPIDWVNQAVAVAEAGQVLKAYKAQRTYLTIPYREGEQPADEPANQEATLPHLPAEEAAGRLRDQAVAPPDEGAGHLPVVPDQALGQPARPGGSGPVTPGDTVLFGGALDWEPWRAWAEGPNLKPIVISSGPPPDEWLEGGEEM